MLTVAHVAAPRDARCPGSDARLWPGASIGRLADMATSDTRSRSLFRMLLLSATIAATLPLMQGMATGAIQGVTRVLLLGSIALAAMLAMRILKQRLKQKASVRRVKELLNFFDDVSLLRPRAQAARAMLAGEPSSDLERRSLVAVTQCLAEMAVAVSESTSAGRGHVLAHPVAGAWLRALAVTPQALSFSAQQRSALQSLFSEVGAPVNRREPLDDGSRALLERDAVLFRADDSERIF